MSRPRFPLFLIVLVALAGCGRSQPEPSAPPPGPMVTMPEDGGQAGNGFASSWTEDYRFNPSQRSTVATRPSPSPSITRPESPKSSPTPTASSPSPPDPMDLAALGPKLEPVVVRISMTDRNGRVKLGAGVVVAGNGLVVTAAGLIEDAVAGEVEFCNKQKTQVIGHFAADNVNPNELVAILIDTHGYALDATSVSPALANQRTTAKIGQAYACFDVRGFPFRPQQFPISMISAERRPGSSASNQAELLTAAAPTDVTQPGSPWFDRSGALIAVSTLFSPGRPLQAIAINEIAGKLPGLTASNVKRYTGTPGATPPPQPFPGPVASASPSGPVKETIAKPSFSNDGLRGSEIRHGVTPAVRILTYRPPVSQQSFVRFAMSADARWAAVVSIDKIFVYNLQTEKLVAEISTSGEKYLDAVFLHNENKLVTLRSRVGIGDRALSLWDLDGLAKVASWEPIVSAIRVAVCADDKFLALTDQRGISIMGTFSNSDKTELRFSAPVPNTIVTEHATALAVDPQGRYVVIGFDSGRAVMLGVNGSEMQKRKQFTPKMGSAIRGLSFSSNGRDLATCGDDGHVNIWSKLDENILSNPSKLREDGRPILDVALGFDGRLAIGAIGKSGAVLWDTLSNRSLDKFTTRSPAVQVAFSETASKFAIVTADGNFVLRPIKGPAN